MKCYLYIHITNGDERKELTMEGLTMEGVRKRRGSIRNWEALIGLHWGFEGGRGRSLAFIARWQRAWVTVWIKEVFLGKKKKKKFLLRSTIV